MANGNLTFRLLLDADTGRFVVETQNSEKAWKSFTGAVQKESASMSGAVDAARNTFDLLKNTLAALGLGVGLKELADTADAFKTLESRIKLAVGEGGNFKDAMSGVTKIAMETRSNLAETGNLFATINRNSKELNITQEQALSLTRTINQAIIVSGGSAETNAAAITQLNQALASGSLRAEELGSVMENSPRLARALADGLNVPIGKLKEMGEAGELTSQRVISALQNQADVINGEFSKMPVTIGGAIENLKTSFTLYIGEVDRANGISAKAAEAIKFLAENLETVASVVEKVGEAYIAYKAFDLAADLMAKAKASKDAAASIASESTALITNTAQNLQNAAATKANAAAKSSLAAAMDEEKDASDKVKNSLDAAAVSVKGVKKETDATKESTDKLGTSLQGVADEADKSKDKTEENSSKLEVLKEASEKAAEGQEALKQGLGIAKKETEAAGESTDGLKDKVGGLTEKFSGALARIGAFAGAAIGFVAAGKAIYDTLVEVGTAIGENTAKWVLHYQGLKTAEEQEKEMAQQEEEAKKRKEAYARAAQDQADKIKAVEYATQGLVGASKELVVEFDKQITAGKSAKEAMDALAKSLQFNSTKSIDTSITALVALQQQGKITEEQVKAVFANALKGEDLVVFETNAKAAFASVSIQINELQTRNADLKQQLTNQRAEFAAWKESGTRSADEISSATYQLQQKTADYGKEIKANEEKIKELSKVHNTEVEKMALLQEQLLNAVIDRTGLSLEQLQGKISKAFNRADNDIQFVIDHLDELKNKGIDTGLILGKSFENAIKTASSQTELDNLSQKIEANRKLLSDKIADGLLQQVQDQAIKAAAAIEAMTPGIQSASEAIHALGFKTKDELSAAADSALKNYQAIGNSAQATAEVQQKALQKVLDAAYESGDATKIAAAQNEAYIKGFTVNVDAAGKASLAAVFGATNATTGLSKGFDRAGNSGVRAAQSVQEAWDNTVTSLSKAAAKLDEMTRKSGQLTGKDFLGESGSSKGTTTGDLNKALNGLNLQAYSEDQIKQKLMQDAGYDEKRAALKAKQLASDNSWAATTFINNDINGKLGMGTALTNYDYINEQVSRLSKVTDGALSGMPDNRAAKTVNINMQLDGKTVNATVPASQEQNFLDMLKQAKKVS